MKCAPRWVIYSDVCTDCKKSGNDGVSTYIGKTNADPRSFQLAHFMESNWTRVTLPEFEFKVIASYEDALRRQLCKELQILQSGTLNRKLEFNNNVI